MLKRTWFAMVLHWWCFGFILVATGLYIPACTVYKCFSCCIEYRGRGLPLRRSLPLWYNLCMSGSLIKILSQNWVNEGCWHIPKLYSCGYGIPANFNKYVLMNEMLIKLAHAKKLHPSRDSRYTISWGAEALHNSIKLCQSVNSHRTQPSSPCLNLLQSSWTTFHPLPCWGVESFF